MCSDRPTWEPPPPPAIAGFADPAEVPEVHPVWVDLEQVCLHDPAKARTVVDGLDMTGKARGMLLRWQRSIRGDWLGLVHYQVHYADGRPQPRIFRDQLVPGYALGPRTDSVPLG
jgi:hypothetical protein